MTRTRKAEQQQRNIEALPFHERRKVQRQQERSKKRREWSANRPIRPEQDELYLQMAAVIAALKGSAWDIADKTGLSTSTIYSLRKASRKTSLGTTLAMAAKAAGGRLVFVKDN